MGKIILEDIPWKQLMQHRPKLNGRSRCGENGKVIGYSCCGQMQTVYHLSWDALWCNACDQEIKKTDIYDLGNK